MPMEFDEKAIQEAVIAEATDRLIADDDLYERAKKAFGDKVDSFFAERAPDLLDAAITDAMEAGLDAVYQPIDQFGRASGDPTSIRDRLGELAQGYWQEKVDRQGERSTDRYNTMTRAEWVVVEVCGKDFHKEVKQEAINVTAALKDGLRAQLRQWVDTTLGELFHVRSQDDKAEGRRK